MHVLHWVLLSIAAQGIGTAAFNAYDEIQNVLDSMPPPGQGWSQQRRLSPERFVMTNGEHLLDTPVPKRRQQEGCTPLTAVS